jgi:hypothetical protein
MHPCSPLKIRKLAWFQAPSHPTFSSRDSYGAKWLAAKLWDYPRRNGREVVRNYFSAAPMLRRAPTGGFTCRRRNNGVEIAPIWVQNRQNQISYEIDELGVQGRNVPRLRYGVGKR